LEYSVLGIGLNVAVDFAEAPAEVRARACSLSEFAAQPVARDVVLDRLLASIERRYSAFALQPELLLAEYRARLLTIGQDVTVGEIHGRALRVEDDGALVVQTSDGESLVRFGDITGS
jgi:biotin-(acetyl-CoA carboxylase) ligase